MSGKTDVSKKQNVYNEASEALYNPYPNFTYDSTFSEVPWPGSNFFKAVQMNFPFAKTVGDSLPLSLLGSFSFKKIFVFKFSKH